jgi:gliding motility-associated-like protein
MNRKILFYQFIALVIMLYSNVAMSQTCLPTDINGTVVNIDCNKTCANLLFKIPHLKSTDDYIVTSIPYKPFQYVTAGGAEDINLYDDDQFSGIINLPFTFCFYDSTYNKVVVGSNGVITFDIANEACANAFDVTQTIPYSAGNICSQFSTYYPRAAIMGVYTDLDPGPGPNNTAIASPSDKKIEWRVEGTAPCRKFVVSYYHIGTFGVNSCGLATPNNFQIVIFESTGLVDIFVGNKTCRSTTNDSKAVMGIQNWKRNKAVAAPGKNSTVWDAVTEGYRFTPNGLTSRFKSCELLTLGGSFIKNADTATTSAGILDLSFNNICPNPGTTTKFLVRTTFFSCISGGSNLISVDTVTVNRSVIDTLRGTVINASCLPGSKGTISITNPIGASMQYSINGGTTFQSSPVFTLAPGKYTITAKNTSTGCISTDSFAITSATNLTANAVTTDAACVGSPSGSITVTASLGTLPYTYSLDGGIFQSSNIFNNVVDGSRAIAVKDNIGCIFNFAVTVKSGPGISASANAINNICEGDAKGSLTITPASGLLPYTYSLNAGVPQLSNIFPNLTAAKYTVLVKDANGCSATVAATILDGIRVVTTAASTNASCAGAATGTITVATPVTGQLPFTYTINSGTPQVSNVFNGLNGGTSYNILVKDANGCSTSILQNVGNDIGVTALAATTNAACIGSATGKIIVSTQSGTSPFSYSLDDVIYQPSNTFSNLVAKTYNVYLKDFNNCKLILTPIISNSPGVAAISNSLNAACTGAATGTIIITPTLGTSPFAFSKDSGLTFQLSGTFRNLLSNNYNLVVKDSNNCIFRAAIPVVNNPGVIVAAIIDKASCAIVPNGKITINPTAGIAPFKYTIDGINFQSANQFAGLFSGPYTISIIDSALCQTSVNVVVGNAARVVIDSVNVVRPSCKGYANGNITIYPSLGVPPYQYALNAGAYQNLNVFTNIAATPGDTIHIRDNSGCIKDTIIAITEPVALSLSTVAVSATCTGTPDGNITISAAGGTTPYMYTKDPALLTGFQSSPILATLQGNYTITVKDANGCTASKSETVLLNDTMRLSLGADTTFCEGIGFTLSPQTNNATTIFNWSPATGLSDATAKNPLASPADTTTYYLTAKWGICQRKDSITLNILLKPIANAGNDTAVCFKTPAYLFGSISQVSGPVTYSWSPSSFLNRTDTTDVTLIADTSGIYKYYLTVKDLYGCNFSNTDTVAIKVQALVPAFAGNDTNAVTGNPLPHQLMATGAGLGGSYQWTWFPADGVVISNPNIANPTVLLQNHNYEFTVKVTDFAGCIGYDKVNITVYDGPTFYLPNAFSPNGDGRNDVFRPIPVGISSTEFFRIINRYGELVFQTSQWMAGWDGTFKGKAMATGTYVWMIKGKDRKGITVQQKGTVVLIR